VVLPLLTFALMLAASEPAAPLPSPSASPASPSPSASPARARKWDECTKSRALPYDRPIGLKMRALDAPDFDLANYRGTAVLLNIFATWCGPCNAEMPGLVEAAKAYAGQGLRVVSIDSGDSDDAVRDFRKKYGITTPIAMDPRGLFARAMEVQIGSQENVTYPMTLFVDPSGYLYCERNGSMSRRELLYRIDRFLTASAGSLAPAPAGSFAPASQAIPGPATSASPR